MAPKTAAPLVTRTQRFPRIFRCARLPFEVSKPAFICIRPRTLLLRWTGPQCAEDTCVGLALHGFTESENVQSSPDFALLRVNEGTAERRNGGTTGRGRRGTAEEGIGRRKGRMARSCIAHKSWGTNVVVFSSPFALSLFE